MKRLLGVLKVMLLQLCAGFAYFSSAQKSVKSSLKIEKRLGRLRKVQEYQSRTIDIDLIAFDSEIIATENWRFRIH
jgi:2-amino-4-hydroxy-6-hydroxymethyldihydropteridine diphosphokinase